VPVIEDCAQALAPSSKAAGLWGSGGTLAVGSFYATKMIAAGEGGAVAGAAALVARVREARDYDERETLAPRTNAKLTDMAAALARGQLARLDAFVARRRALAARYAPFSRARRPGCPPSTDRVTSTTASCSARPRSRRRRRRPRRARRGRAAAGVPSRSPRAWSRRVPRRGPAVGGIAVDPVLSGAHRRGGRARRAGAQGGARGMPPGGHPQPEPGT